jgi:glycine/D-amino acid oxidase-like deaminating enzyme
MTNFPVVIVGSGPAGLSAAIALARRGIESLIVDQRHKRSSLPRATTISTRSMELIRAWGVEQEILAGGVDVEWLMWESPTLARATEGVAIEVGLPTRAQAALISPTAPACVPQDHLERVLLDHLRLLGTATIELGTTLIGLEDQSDHVRVTLRNAAGQSRVVTAGYVVAADGARSTVRGALGIPMRARRTYSEVPTRCSTHRCGLRSTTIGTASTWRPSPAPRASSCRQVRATAGATAFWPTHVSDLPPYPASARWSIGYAAQQGSPICPFRSSGLGRSPPPPRSLIASARGGRFWSVTRLTA